MSALRTVGIVKRFGAVAAVDGVTLELARGARHALIGPNGAGKTTFIDILSGALAPTAGEVLLDDEPVTRMPQHARVKRGLARTFQVTSLFPRLTVLECVVLAILERNGMARRWWRPVRDHDAEVAEGNELLAALGLHGDANRRVMELAYGRQRLVEIALGLAVKPRVLLLDEPAAGIPRGESSDVLAVVAALPPDVTVLFIEHDMDLVFRFAQRVTVLAAGRILAEGTPAQVAGDERVRAVYLGRDSA